MTTEFRSDVQLALTALQFQLLFSVHISFSPFSFALNEIYEYKNIYLSIYLSTIYTYIYICIDMNIYIYIYIFEYITYKHINMQIVYIHILYLIIYIQKVNLISVLIRYQHFHYNLSY